MGIVVNVNCQHVIYLFRRYKDSKREFRQRLRQAPRLHEQEEFSRIEQLSELDQKGFWKVISSRKPKKRSSGRELVFGGSKLAH